MVVAFSISEVIPPHSFPLLFLRRYFSIGRYFPQKPFSVLKTERDREMSSRAKQQNMEERGAKEPLLHQATETETEREGRSKMDVDLEQGKGLAVDPERGSFVNERGLHLQRYTWRASALMSKGFGTAQGKEPAGTNEDTSEKEKAESEEQLPPAAIIIFVHGYCVHARYEALLPEYPGAPGHDKYEGSITHRLNEVGCDVLAFDLQGHGLSDKLHGLSCYVDDFDDFSKDVIQFIKIVKDEYTKKVSSFSRDVPPIYVLGASMGGLVAIRTIQLAPDLADGLVLLAPAIMMLDEADHCCWYYLKQPILRMMKPILGRVKMIHRYVS